MLPPGGQEHRQWRCKSGPPSWSSVRSARKDLTEGGGNIQSEPVRTRSVRLSRGGGESIHIEMKRLQTQQMLGRS